MKHYILALVLAMASINAAIAANPIREGNMISGHVLVKGSEENIPYATVLIVGSGQGTVSNEEGQFELKNLPAGKYTLRVSAVGYKTQEKEIEVNKDFTAVVHFQMQEESFMTDEVVVSAIAISVEQHFFVYFYNFFCYFIPIIFFHIILYGRVGETQYFL